MLQWIMRRRAGSGGGQREDQRIRAVSIAADTIRRGNTTAKYRRKACSIWNRRSVLSLPRILRTTVTPSHKPYEAAKRRAGISNTPWGSTLSAAFEYTAISAAWRYRTPQKNPFEPMDRIGTIPMITPETRMRIDAVT